MNLFFEYLFCRHYWWFSQVVLERKYIDPVFHSILAMSVIHGWCIIPIYNLFYLFLYKSYYIDNILGINSYLFIGVIVTLIDFIYFNRKRRTALWEQFKKIPKKEKRRKDIIIIIIIINVSITILFRSQNLK